MLVQVHVADSVHWDSMFEHVLDGCVEEVLFDPEYDMSISSESLKGGFASVNIWESVLEEEVLRCFLKMKKRKVATYKVCVGMEYALLTSSDKN